MRETILPLTEVKAQLSRYVEDVVISKEVVVITVNNKRKAVLMDYEEWDSIMETLDVLNDPELSRDLLDRQKNIDEGIEEESIPFDEAMKKLGWEKRAG